MADMPTAADLHAASDADLDALAANLATEKGVRYVLANIQSKGLSFALEAKLAGADIDTEWTTIRAQVPDDMAAAQAALEALNNGTAS